MYRSEMVNTLSTLLKIPSVFSSDAKPGAPFGEGIAKALDVTLEIGSNMGFATKNLDGYVGEIQLNNGRNMIGILCHIDVVEPGDGWTTPPFEPTLIGDNLYGRGSIDDKAGIVCALYAMKHLKDNRLLRDDFSIRLIIGTDEELGWNDMNYYRQHADRFPDVSLVVDANFPVIYCEKGLWDFNLTWKTPDNDLSRSKPIQIVELTGGVARNAVPSKATAILTSNNADEVAERLKKQASDDRIDCEITAEENEVRIVTRGVGVHAMWPEKGKSAINGLMALLSALPENEFSGSEFAKAYMHAIGDDFTGGKLGIDCADDESGALTFVVGQIDFNAETGEYSLISGLRYPSSKDFSVISDKMTSSIAEYHFKVTPVDHLAPVFFKKDNPIIKTLMEAYVETTGDKTNEPLAIGGATYSRSLPNAIAFGPLFPWEQELAHEPNEFMNVHSLEKACDVIIAALVKLQSIQSFDN